MQGRPDAQPTNDQIRKALDAVQDALGADAVLQAPEGLRDLRDPYTFAGWRAHEAAGAVEPRTVEEVREVLRIAAETGVPVWTVSQGRNYGYGGAAPVVSGSIVLSLRRMNRILEINDDAAYAIVEPGVRYFDLFNALRAGGHRLWPSIPDLGWGSVVGNTLDHGVGFTPLGDHPGRACGMEVVLPDGDVLRTGMGGLPASQAWPLVKRGFGPSPDGLFMQSNYGVVTKMGIWLMPEPDWYMSGDVRVERDSDLEALVDAVRPLLLDGTIPNQPVVYNALRVVRGFAGVDRTYWYDGPDPVPDAVAARMQAETDCGAWFMRFALYGRADAVDGDFRACRKAFSGIPGARVEGRRVPGAEVTATAGRRAERRSTGPKDAVEGMRAQAAAIQAGVPGLALLQNVSWEEQGYAGHVDYSPTAPLNGSSARSLVDFLRTTYRRHGVDHACSLMLHPRSMTAVNALWFDTRDEHAAATVFDLLRDLIRSGAELGYAPYRAHLDVMDLVADQFSNNDHAQRRFNERVKDLLDPHGILSPGKQGIWPRRLRDLAG